MRTALVTGVAGQDGIYLARSLLADGIRVVGTVSGPVDNQPRHVYLAGAELRSLDLRDGVGLRALVAEVEPDEVYNLAAVSSVGRSWHEPELTKAVNQTAVEILVEALLAQRDRTGRQVHLFQASSAEVSGDATASPYARSKAAAEDVVRDARDRGLAASIGRLYIHESPLRAVTFVSRKITQGAAEIALGRRDRLVLGNLDVVRDWGFAGDYVEAIRLMVAADVPVDLPIGTGDPRRLVDLVERAFVAAGLDGAEGYVDQDPSLVRPADTAVMVADPEPAAAAIGWRATRTFEETIDAMVAADLARLRSGVDEAEAYLGKLPLPERETR
ncbi:GDP-mannose 4,6-dehydratase [Nocardioides sp. WS12]|uniref:GDP-mannose 4,6-dehydratase n=1 Tax=Nocardioides sp. WS12 TaxID=2486272 RepID=UPI0015F8BEB2|nr:GDP-mannose 4,6-dehydratase [Nocardioides sp. WS12]